MGYTTKFSGAFDVSRPLTLAEAADFMEIYDAIWDDNSPEGSPGGYLQWVPSEDLQHIVWDQNEKFYEYDVWLQWVVDHFARLNIQITGQVNWHGESAGDSGVLGVTAAKVWKQPVNPKSKANHSPLTAKSIQRKLAELAREQLRKDSTRG